MAEAVTAEKAAAIAAETAARLGLTEEERSDLELRLKHGIVPAERMLKPPPISIAKPRAIAPVTPRVTMPPPVRAQPPKIALRIPEALLKKPRARKPKAKPAEAKIVNWENSGLQGSDGLEWPAIALEIEDPGLEEVEFRDTYSEENNVIAADDLPPEVAGRIAEAIDRFVKGKLANTPLLEPCEGMCHLEMNGEMAVTRTPGGKISSVFVNIYPIIPANDDDERRSMTPAEHGAAAAYVDSLEDFKAMKDPLGPSEVLSGIVPKKIDIHRSHAGYPNFSMAPCKIRDVEEYEELGPPGETKVRWLDKRGIVISTLISGIGSGGNVDWKRFRMMEPHDEIGEINFYSMPERLKHALLDAVWEGGVKAEGLDNDRLLQMVFHELSDPSYMLKQHPGSMPGWRDIDQPWVSIDYIDPEEEQKSGGEIVVHIVIPAPAQKTQRAQLHHKDVTAGEMLWGELTDRVDQHAGQLFLWDPATQERKREPGPTEEVREAPWKPKRKRKRNPEWEESGAREEVEAQAPPAPPKKRPMAGMPGGPPMLKPPPLSIQKPREIRLEPAAPLVPPVLPRLPTVNVKEMLLKAIHGIQEKAVQSCRVEIGRAAKERKPVVVFAQSGIRKRAVPHTRGVMIPSEIGGAYVERPMPELIKIETDPDTGLDRYSLRISLDLVVMMPVLRLDRYVTQEGFDGVLLQRDPDWGYIEAGLRSYLQDCLSAMHLYPRMPGTGVAHLFEFGEQFIRSVSYAGEQRLHLVVESKPSDGSQLLDLREGSPLRVDMYQVTRDLLEDARDVSTEEEERVRKNLLEIFEGQEEPQLAPPVKWGPLYRGEGGLLPPMKPNPEERLVTEETGARAAPTGPRPPAGAPGGPPMLKPPSIQLRLPAPPPRPRLPLRAPERARPPAIATRLRPWIGEVPTDAKTAALQLWSEAVQVLSPTVQASTNAYASIQAARSGKTWPRLLDTKVRGRWKDKYKSYAEFAYDFMVQLPEEIYPEQTHFAGPAVDLPWFPHRDEVLHLIRHTIEESYATLGLEDVQALSLSPMAARGRRAWLDVRFHGDQVEVRVHFAIGKIEELEASLDGLFVAMELTRGR